MKILLLSPPYLPEYMRNARCDFVSLSATQWYPLLLGYCGAYLEGLGHEVKLIDAPAHSLSIGETLAIVNEFAPDLLVLYTGRLSEDSDISLGERIVNEIGCKAVIVGPYASINPESTLSKTNRIKYLVSGEFEHPVAEITAGIAPDKIKNLWYKDGELIKSNPERPYLSREQLDEIPFISKFFKKQKEFDVFRYKTISEPYPYMDIFTGRGCIWGMCTYCLWVHKYIKGMTYNTRSVENVINELKFIENDFPEIKSVMFQDDTFTEERAIELCEAKIKSGVKIKFSCYARGNMSYDVLRLMKKAGCLNLHVGYESADPEILRTVKKGMTVERMTRFTEDAKRAGLRIHGDFAFGFPGETEEKAMKTIDWACRLRPYSAQFQIMIPFPGTPYYEMMKGKGWLNENGEPDMPQFPNWKIRQAAKHAYRKFYISWNHIAKCIRHPVDNIFSKHKTIYRAIPAIFWKKWEV
jgi:radical SAM superfamily enzyme YgiQ (UPF0313 family)